MLTHSAATGSAERTATSAKGASGPSSEPEREGSESGSRSGDLLQVLLQSFQEIWVSVESLIEVKADRIRISVERSIVRATLGACAAVCLALWLGAAALSVLRGARGGLTALWGGNEWMGDLTGGLLAWALAAVAIAIHLRLSSRRELAKLKAKYERIRNRHDARTGTPASASDGGAGP